LKTKELIQILTEASGVSGHEEEVARVIEGHLKDYCDELKRDALGNIIALKKGTKGNSKIMLAAHMDEIGLMVKDIDEKGFIRFTNIGGVDQRTLLCQEVVIHGTEKVYGIIGVKPPHLTTAEERGKALTIEQLMIDTGYSQEELKELVSIGDVITIKRNLLSLKNDWISGKALDDRVGVAVLYACLKELQNVNHQADVYCVATVQEEVGTRGAVTSTYGIDPDINII